MSDGSILWQLVLQLLLILINSVFACAEIAVISMNDTKLAKLAAMGDKRAIKLTSLTSQPARFLSTIQVGITLAGFLASAFAAGNFSERLVRLLVDTGIKIPEPTLDTISVILITIILSYFTLIFGELVPKRLAMRNAEKLALGMSGLIYSISKVFTPIVALLTVSTNGILRLLGIDPHAAEEAVTEEEIRMMVEEGSEKGTIDADEKEMIQNVFEFDDKTARDVMTHRTDVSLLWLDESVEQWDNTIVESRHSVYPICDETTDDIVGILSSKDYFRIRDKTRENIMKIAVKPAYFVPESVRADLLFQNMKNNRQHFAIVLDEFGGMDGIVTMNDLLEELVGDLEDDISVPAEPLPIERIDCETWKVRGSASLGEVVEHLGVPLPENEYDTFGGFVFGRLGYIPDDGSTPELDEYGLHIKVSKIEDHQLEKAIVCREQKLPES